MKNLAIIVLLLLCYAASAQTPELQANAPSKELVSKQKIKVFPNPATNVVNILGLKNSNRANITISDISGNIVLQYEWAIRNNSVTIPIPNLTTGIYIVQINSKEQQVQTKFYKN